MENVKFPSYWHLAQLINHFEIWKFAMMVDCLRISFPFSRYKSNIQNPYWQIPISINISRAMGSKTQIRIYWSSNTYIRQQPAMAPQLRIYSKYLSSEYWIAKNTFWLFQNYECQLSLTSTPFFFSTRKMQIYCYDIQNLFLWLRMMEDLFWAWMGRRSLGSSEYPQKILHTTSNGRAYSKNRK